MLFEKNKKGIFYWYIMGFMAIILWVVFTWLSLGVTRASIYDENHEILNSVDFQSTYIDVEKQFIDIYLNNELKNIKSNFFRAKVLQNSLGENIDESTLYACSLSTKPVFYNERVLDSTILDLDLEDNSCLLDFDLFLEEFSDVAIEKIENDIGTFYLSNSFVSLEGVETQIDEKSGLVNLVVLTKMSDYVKFGEIESLNRYEKEIVVGDYKNLLNYLSQVLPEFSDKIKKDMTKCVDANTNSNLDKYTKENICYNILFKEIFDYSDYTFEIKKDSSLSNSEYIVLDFKFFKSTGELELVFYSVFRNNIPFGVVEFELTNANYLNNIIDVELTKFVSSVATPDKYMIIYSYENFLDEQLYGKQRYDEFISMLENSEIPLGFDDTGYEVLDSKYYHSSQDNSVNLNLISVSGTGFDSNNKKTIPIYQIYNFNSGEYEILEPNREVYVAIFGVDPPGYNYFTDRDLLELAFKNLETKIVLGPNPLKSASFIGTISNQQEAINIKIDNVDDSVYSYGIYVYENGNPLPQGFGKECNINYCYVEVLKGDEPNFILTSSDNDFGTTYSSVHRLNGFELQHNVFYNVMIVTQDSDGNGILQDSSSSNSIVQVSDFYKLEKNSAQAIKPFRNTQPIKVIDSLAPTDDSYSILSNKLRLENGKLYLQWSPNDSDVVSFYAQVLVDNSETRNIKILSDSSLPFIQYDSSLVITKLSPIDFADNSKYNNFNIDSAPNLATPISYP